MFKLVFKNIKNILLKGQSNSCDYVFPPHLRFNDASVFDYNFLMSLDEKYYPKYLCEAYQIKTLTKLNLFNPKTLNEKIQWLKIYDNKHEKSELTDKVLVRDWVKNHIGEEYLKPALWIGDKFENIPFESLPNSFIIKCNHGCKWQVVIKDKQKFCDNKKLFKSVKIQVENWLLQSFFGWSDFETQYKTIIPKIIIEELLFDENNCASTQKIRNWCFNGKPQYTEVTRCSEKFGSVEFTTFDINLNATDICFEPKYVPTQLQVDDKVLEAYKLSKILSKNFKLVRVDWMVFKGKLYFEEMTFTPYSGFLRLNTVLQKKLGKQLNLKGN